MRHLDPDCRERIPYSERPAEKSDADDRISLGITPADYGVKWRSAYADILGPRPVCGPRDHAKARLYLERIRLAINRGGWTNNEWTRLRRLERTWEKRAAGMDPVYEVVGNRGGKINQSEARLIQAIRVMMTRVKGDRKGDHGNS